MRHFNRIRYAVGAKYFYLEGRAMSAKKVVKKKSTNQPQEKTNKPKKITLRAYSIKNNTMSKPSSMLYSNLLEKLESSVTSEDRCMLLNEEDEKKERDLISNYKITQAIDAIFGTLVRIAASSDLPNISEELLKKKIFSPEDFSENLTGNICKDHYYFLLDDNYIITYWAGNRTIKSLQTYISWYVGDELLEFTPMVAAPSDIKLSDLNFIKIQDPISVKNTNNEVAEDSTNNTNIATLGNKKLQLGKAAFNYLKDIIALNDVTSIKEEELQQIISAELSIIFKKPRKMTEDEYAKILGATLKPMSDLDSAIFSTKKTGKIVTGKDLLKTKVLDIDTTDNGKISEPALHQEMSKFLKELKGNEKNNS